MAKIALPLVWIVVTGLSIAGCASTQKNILATQESQLRLRTIQSRVFETGDSQQVLRVTLATLQDLGFVIDKANESLGTISGTKRSGYTLRMTVSIRPKGGHQIIVRSNAQYNLATVEDPEPYQQFFAALSKALFLEAQGVE
jgi:hypothetical protein